MLTVTLADHISGTVWHTRGTGLEMIKPHMLTVTLADFIKGHVTPAGGTVLRFKPWVFHDDLGVPGFKTT
jgi:hypothetical protein